MKVLFLHGLESTPGGKKPACFLEAGHEVINPALPAGDFEGSVRIGQAAYDEGQPDLVVGSSRGGAVAMTLEIGDTPLLLVCPAWKKWGNATSVKPDTIIMHSQADEIIPYAYSQELLEASPGARLVEAGADHRMADSNTLAIMVRLGADLVGSGDTSR